MKSRYFAGALLFSAASLTASASTWTTVDRDSLDSFNPNCLYMAQLDSNMLKGISQPFLLPQLFNTWTLATGVSANILEFSPIQSETNAGQVRVIISATNKGDDYIYIPGQKPVKGTFSDQELRRYCRPDLNVEPVDVRQSSDFDQSCIYRMQDGSPESGAWYIQAQSSLKAMEFIPYLYLGQARNYTFEIISTLKNTTHISAPNSKQKKPTQRFTRQCGYSWKAVTGNNIDSSCLYRVQLDGKQPYQMVYSVEDTGNTLYASSFIPNGYAEGVTISISSFDLSQYTLTQNGKSTTGRVTGIEQHCPGN